MRRRPPPPAETPMDPRSIERFCIALSGQPLPPVKPGYIRLLTHRFGTLPLTWFNAQLLAYDRTFIEWHAWMNSLSTQDAEHAYMIFCKTMQLRNRFRKLLVCYRMNKAAGSIVGETDLYTLEAIPLRQQVRVLDLLQKRTYVFHAATLEKVFLSALSYSYYGVADPSIPKNPYTNLPWSIHQCIHIVQQLSYIRTSNHQFLNNELIDFAKAGYDVRKYFHNNRLRICVRATEAYFAQPLNPDAEIDYAEALDELYDDHIIGCNNGNALIRTLVKGRLLSNDYMKRWDAVVLGYWIWKTYGIFHSSSWTSLSELMRAVYTLHTASLLWWRSQPRRILHRATEPAAVAGGATTAIPVNTVDV